MGKFKLKNKATLKEIYEGRIDVLPESDLALQDDGMILQFDYVRDEKEQKQVIVKPGSYNLAKGMQGIELTELEFVARDILTTVTNTTNILNEADRFFNNLAVYDDLKQPKKRGILLYGTPGQGKTVSIMQAAKDLRDRDPGTVIINWPTSEIEASGVFKFFTKYSEYTSDCTKLILVIEDIGGSSHEGSYRRDEVSSSLLNLLDGINNVFKLPTLIISTTNHPENLMKSLADRPGRFDMMLEVESPNFKERVQLVEFIAKRELNEEEKAALSEKNNKGVEKFSVAHLQEIVVRSRLHNKSVAQVVQELIKHSSKFKIDFTKQPKNIGFDSDGED